MTRHRSTRLEGTDRRGSPGGDLDHDGLPELPADLRADPRTADAELSPADRFARAADRSAHRLLTEFAATRPFAFDPFQVEACRALEEGGAVLVCAPTGAGKTVVGEFAVHRALATGGKCFYTTPIKALSNQKFADLVAQYGPDRVGLLTGDTSINSHAPVVVMTTEVLRNMLYAGSRDLAGLTAVVMDEIHYLADKFRGAVWEEVILHLAPQVQVVGLSATVSNAEEFGAWLQTVRGRTTVVVDEIRPVPLWQHMLVGRRLFDLFSTADIDAVDGTPTARVRVDPALARAVADAEALADRYGPSGRGRGRGGGPQGYRGVPRWRPPARVDVIERLDGAGAAARHHVHLLARRLRRRGAAVRALRDAADDREGARGDPADRRPAHRRAGRGRPRRAGLLGLAGRPGAGHRRAPRRAAAGVQGDRGGAVRRRPGEGGVRDRDARARHQHARPDRRAGEAEQVQRRGSRRPDAGGVHPADGPGRPPRDRRRGARGCRLGAGGGPAAVGGLASRRTYPLRSSFRPSYNMAVNLVGRLGRDKARELLEQSFAQFQANAAVVGMARQVAKNAEAIQAHERAMHCHLGDTAEYLALVTELADAEKATAKAASSRRRDQTTGDLVALKRGDVVSVPAGRRSGLAVVLDPGVDADGGARPLVITAGRWAGRLSAADFRGPVPSLGRIRLGKFTDHRSPRVRRDVASALASSGITAPTRQSRRPAENEDVDLTVLRRAVRAHPVHGCADRDEHLQWARRWRRLREENDSLAARVAHARSSLGQALDRILALLADRGYVHGDTVDAAGRMLARIWSESDLVVAESLRRGVWDGLGPAELAAAVSVLLFESRRENPGPARPPAGDAAPAITATVRIWAEIAAQERSLGLPPTREPDYGFATAVAEWARGGSLADALSVAATSGIEISAGDFVRWCRQVVDLLDQIAVVAPEPVGPVARAGVTALRRGVVAMGTT